MIKKILPLLLILSACSSTVEKQRTISNNGELAWIDELDFDPKAEAVYRSDNDEYRPSGSDESENALAKESLAVVGHSKLETALNKGDDALMKITANCYLNKFDEAFAIADSLYASYKSNTSYWNQIGTCYYLNGDFSKALLFYNKSRDLDKKYVPAINNLGVVYERQGKHQKALAAYKLASDTNKFAITPTFNLAQLYLKFGTVGKAFPIFRGLYNKSPKDVDVAAALATSHLIKGDYQEAVNIYSKLSKEAIERPEIGVNYALALKFTNKTDEANKVLSNMGTPLGELADYTRKVESFVRN